MTVSSSYAPIESAGNDVTVAFPVTWSFFDSTLVVTLTDSSGVETVQTITTHYSVSGGTDADGLPATGTVTMVTAPATGETLTIERATPRTQPSTWGENDAFPQATIEAALDRLTLISQETNYAAAVGDLIRLNTAGATDYWDVQSEVVRNVADAVNATDAVNYGQLQQVVIDAGAGDVVGPGSSTDGQAALFDGTGGNTLKAFTGTGLLKAASGVLAQAVAGTDYVTPTGLSGSSSVQKGDGSGGLTAAAATDLGAGKHTIWIPASAMTPRTTDGAAVGTIELPTYDFPMSFLDFDASTEEGAGVSVGMPASWDGGEVTFVPYWTAASGSGGVVWQLRAASHGDSDDLDRSMGTGQTSTDTFLSAYQTHIGPESAAITVGWTPAPNELVNFQIVRVVSDGSDTLAVDAKLIGIHLYITTDALTDA